MGRVKVKKYAKCFFEAEVFFLTDMQKDILETALKTVGVPYGSHSKAIRRGLALTFICNEFLKSIDVK